MRSAVNLERFETGGQRSGRQNDGNLAFHRAFPLSEPLGRLTRQKGYDMPACRFLACAGLPSRRPFVDRRRGPKGMTLRQLAVTVRVSDHVTVCRLSYGRGGAADDHGRVRVLFAVRRTAGRRSGEHGKRNARGRDRDFRHHRGRSARSYGLSGSAGRRRVAGDGPLRNAGKPATSQRHGGDSRPLVRKEFSFAAAAKRHEETYRQLMRETSGG